MKLPLHILLFPLSAAALLSSCIDEVRDAATDAIPVTFLSSWPEELDPSSLTSATINFTELNSGATSTLNLKDSSRGTLPLGIYDFEGTATVTLHDDATDTDVVKTLRVSGNSVTVTSATSLPLAWFFSNPGGTLVFSEIYATGSPNATATGGLRDTYLTIYNNTDEVQYADGLGIVESSFTNSKTNTVEVLTPANNRQVNFTASTVWVIPGSGKDHPLQPGESLKIVDQAIDWSAQVPGALNHTDASFEWYDDNAQDTDNPSVPNLDKWYSYSNTIWLISNQCNRSYALVRFPEGMTAERYLAEYRGAYEYKSTLGNLMYNDKAYLIPNSWIIDGVNLGNAETYVYGALGNSVDISYASISDINKDPNRFGLVFRRKPAATLPSGTILLQDTNDSRADFRREPVK